MKRDYIRPGTPLDIEDARRIVGNFLERYNTVRLHSAIGYVAPLDKLEGWAEAILAEGERKLEVVRERRARMRSSSSEKCLTNRREETTIRMVGEMEAGNAGERPARDSRPGQRAFIMGACSMCVLSPCAETPNA